MIFYRKLLWMFSLYFSSFSLTLKSYASNSIQSIVIGALMMRPIQQQCHCSSSQAFAEHSDRKMHDLGSHRFDCESMKVAIKMGNFRMHPCGCWSIGSCPNSAIPMISTLATVHASMVPEVNSMINPVLCWTKWKYFFFKSEVLELPCTKHHLLANTHLKLTHCPIACKLLPDSRRLPFNLSVWSRFNVRNDRVDISEILLSLNSK